MRVAGGIIALIAGILAFFAALFTISIGGAAAAFEAEGGDTVIALGFGGVFFSLAVIIFGAIAIGVKGKKWPGICLIVSSLLGAVLGGTFVAVLLILSLIGGILVLFDKTPAMVPTAQSPSIDAANSTSLKNDPVPPQKGKALKVVGIIILILIALITLIALIPTSDTSVSEQNFDSSVVSQTGERARQKNDETLHVSYDAATVGNFKVQIDNVEFLKSVGSEFFKEEARSGELYVTGVLTYTNIGKKPVSAFSSPNLHLIDADGNRYDPNIGISAAYATQLDIDQNVLSDINPGITYSDSSAFVVSTSLFDPETWMLEVKSSGEKLRFSISPSYSRDETIDNEQVNGTPSEFTSVNKYDFLLDMSALSLTLAHVESKLGPPKRFINYRDAWEYEFGECVIIIGGEKVVKFIEFTSSCSDETKNLTIGDVLSHWVVDKIDGCIRGCGNSADPTISLRVEGPRSNGFTNTHYITVQNDDVSISKMDDIESRLKNLGLDYYDLSEIENNEILQSVYGILADVRIDKVQLGDEYE